MTKLKKCKVCKIAIPEGESKCPRCGRQFVEIPQDLSFQERFSLDWKAEQDFVHRKLWSKILELIEKYAFQTGQDWPYIKRSEEKPKPATRRGRWIEKTLKKDAPWPRMRVCSSCLRGLWFLTSEYKRSWDMSKTAFCPHCGAKMENGDERDEC